MKRRNAVLLLQLRLEHKTAAVVVQARSQLWRPTSAGDF